MIRAVLILWLAAAPALAEGTKQRTLIEFEIEDQFREKHTHREFIGKALIVVGSNKGGKDYNEPWAETLRDSLDASGHDVSFLGLADVRGVPFFLKGMIRGKFPKSRDRWALADWKGEFAKAYCFEKDHCNVLVFDPEGNLVHHSWVKEVEPVKLGLVLAAARRVAPLREPKPASAPESESE